MCWLHIAPLWVHCSSKDTVRRWTMNGEELAGKRCRPCEAGTPPLGEGEIGERLAQLEGWQVQGGMLVKTYRFKPGTGMPLNENLDRRLRSEIRLQLEKKGLSEVTAEDQPVDALVTFAAASVR